MVTVVLLLFATGAGIAVSDFASDPQERTIDGTATDALTPTPTPTSTPTSSPTPVPALGAWTRASVAAPPLEDAASVTANGFAYVVGGKSGTGALQRTVYYARLNADGSTGSWTTTTQLPATREDLNAVVAKGRLYAIGGGSPNNAVYSALLNSNGTVGAWRAEPVLPVALDDPASVVVGEYLYVTGGLNGTVRKRVYYARLSSAGALGAWQTEADLLPDGGRAEHTAFAANGYLYVVGGGNPAVQDEVFYARLNPDGSTAAWQTAGHRLPEVRLDHTTVVSGGVAYVIGGINGSSTPHSSVYTARLNADGATGPWAANTSLPAPREDATTVLYNGFVYVFAGKHGAVQNTTYFARVN